MDHLDNFTNTQMNLSSNFNTTNITDFVVNNSTTTEKSLLYVVPGPLICIFGIVCNILNLCVLSQKILNDSPYIYLTALAVSDLTLLTISFIHLVSSKASGTFIKAFYDIYIFFTTANIFFNSSVWLVVVLTIERVLFVTRPLTFRPSKIKARWCIAIVFLLCSVINIPRFFTYKITTAQIDHYYPQGTAFRKSELFYQVSWFHAMVINFVPFVTILVTNSVLVYGLHKARKERVSLHSNQEHSIKADQTRLTRTLVAVVVTFFICTVPSAFVDDPIAYSLFGEGRTWKDYIESPANQMFIHISNLLLFLNSSLNFLLYCSFNKKFRSATKSFFAKTRVCRRQTRLERQTSDNDNSSGSKRTNVTRL
ncbi:hypothetical protein ACF0H5_008149 [Mactra antiquata]